MPILDVLLVVPEGAPLPAGLAAAIADGAGTLLNAPAGRVWVRLSVLPADHYAENGVAPADLPRPVFVTVMHADLPDAEQLSAQARALSDAVAWVVGCDADRVHVEFAPSGRGRVAFGGRLLT